MKELKRIENIVSKSVGRAIAEHSMIQNNDKILVGVSGGKDSLTLLKILSLRRKWVPIKYSMMACHVISNSACDECHELEQLKKMFNDLDCSYTIERSEIADDKESASCFWCAWNRRKALFRLAEKTGCTKIALGHHMDDLIETTLMNLFFNGEIASMNAKQPLFNGKIVIIRPMIYLEEKKISIYAKKSKFPVSLCKCPNAGVSKRAYVKDLIKKLDRDFKYVKKNIMNAPSRIKEEYLGVRYEQKIHGESLARN